MKKSLLTMAALAAFSPALFAQSSVTLFGVLDAGVGRISNSGAGSTNGITNGANTTSRLGFRGTEDLGGGLAASFWLEGEVQADNGNAAGFNFVRRSTVSLSGNFGEVRLGRDFTAHYLNMIAFDSAAQRGFGTIENYGPGAGVTTSGGAGLSYIRTSNAVSYFLPATLGGFYGSVQYAFGERNSDTPTTATNSDKQGNYLGGRAGFTNGALDVAAGYGVFYDVSRNAAYVDDYKVANLGASYNFGFIKPMAFFQRETLDGRGALPEFKFNTYAIGFTAPLGAGLLRGQISRYDNKSANASNLDANKVSVGYAYNLSKRTAIYAEVARVNNQGAGNFVVGTVGGSIPNVNAPTPGGNSTGYVVGLKHTF
ncbi:porin [Xylophilus sp. GOD-11R]|uniref:porin n=1 Tax=Xylophilus sp. GOD-11R TaxID=3089814 RepID=UPI00298CA376|nr:porin [Xylophilus sp. GOD-11R]WPB55910.1 porin [Xylophilus sp. GOD-11R]